MPDSSAIRIKRFRDRAEEIRRKAGAMQNPTARQAMMAVAESFERLAAFLERGGAGG